MRLGRREKRSRLKARGICLSGPVFAPMPYGGEGVVVSCSEAQIRRDNQGRYVLAVSLVNGGE